MSAKSTVNNGKTMQCKVCLDAGKSKDQYSSHWVKDRNGKVVCPTLLSVKCPNCSYFGHTVKFCTVVKKNNNASYNNKPITKNDPVIESKNIFERLSHQSVSENQTKNMKQIVEDFPALNSRNITLRPHQKHFANEVVETYMDCLLKEREEKNIYDTLNALRAAKAEREADEANGIVEKPYLTKDITLRGSANITLRAHQKHYTIEEGEEYDPFFGSEKIREIKKHNRSCFLGENGLSWVDVIDSDSEEEEEEEFEEEDYDW